MSRACKIVAWYTHGSVFCCLPPFTHIWHFSPGYPSPSPPPRCPSPIAHNRPQCVVPASPCPCVLIFPHPPMSENMWYFFFCSCVSLLRMMFSRFIHVPTKDMNSSFLIAALIFHGVYVPHFPSSVYHRWAFALVPGLCYCKQCCNELSCACVLVVERFIVLWIYTQ